jgi:hypothetical protein
MSPCELAQPIMAFAFAYLGYAILMVIGILLLPGKFSVQLASSRTALFDAWAKSRAGTWQSPVFALFLPVLWVAILPMAYPLAVFVASALVLLVGSFVGC